MNIESLPLSTWNKTCLTRILVFCSLCSLTPEIQGQTTYNLKEAKESDENALTSGSIKHIYSSADRSDFFYLKREKKETYLHSINESLVASEPSSQYFKIDKRQYELKDFLLLGDRQFGVYTPYLWKKDLMSEKPIFVREYNRDGEPFEDFRAVAEFPFEKFDLRKNRFKTSTSKNASKILFSDCVPRKALEYEYMGFVILDKELNPLKTFEVRLPYEYYSKKKKSRILRDYSAYVSEQGSVTLLCTFWDKKVDDWGVDLFYFDMDDLSEAEVIIDPVRTTLKTDFGPVTLARLTELQNGSYVCHGTSSWGRDGSANVFSARVENGMFQVIEEVPFSNALVLKGERRKTRLKREKQELKENDSSEYEFSSLVVRTVEEMNSGFMLIMEEHWSETEKHTYTTSEGSVKTTTVTHHHRGDVIMTMFSLSGLVQWSEKLVKHQYGKSEYEELSIIWANERNKMHLFYNGNWNNESAPLDNQKVFDGGNSNSAVLHYSIDENGKSEEQILWKTSERKTSLVPRLSVKSSMLGKVYFPLKTKQSFSFGIFSFQ